MDERGGKSERFLYFMMSGRIAFRVVISSAILGSEIANNFLNPRAVRRSDVR